MNNNKNNQFLNQINKLHNTLEIDFYNIFRNMCSDIQHINYLKDLKKICKIINKLHINSLSNIKNKSLSKDNNKKNKLLKLFEDDIKIYKKMKGNISPYSDYEFFNGINLLSISNENNISTKINYLLLITSLIASYSAIATIASSGIFLAAQVGVVLAGQIIFSTLRTLTSIDEKNRVKFYTKYMPNDSFTTFRAVRILNASFITNLNI
jgi:hypothetical protein